MFNPRRPLKNEVAQVNNWSNLAHQWVKPDVLGYKKDLSMGLLWALARIEDQQKEILSLNKKLVLHTDCFEVSAKLMKERDQLKDTLTANGRFCERFHTQERIPEGGPISIPVDLDIINKEDLPEVEIDQMPEDVRS